MRAPPAACLPPCRSRCGPPYPVPLCCPFRPTRCALTSLLPRCACLPLLLHVQAEDHLFGDKEKFVTAAYRAKLAERQAWQEEQKRKWVAPPRRRPAPRCFRRLASPVAAARGSRLCPPCSLVACQAGCMRAPGACTTGGPQPTAAPRALSPSVCRKAEEEANAVEKRGHMGDFYRNLLRSNVAFGSKAAADGKEAEKAAAAAAAGGEQRQPGPGGAAAAAQQEGQGQRRAVEPGQAQREQEEAMAAEAAKQRAQRGAAPAAAAPAAEQQQQQAGPPVVPAGAAASGSAAAEEGVPPAGAGAAEETAPATEAVQRRNKDDAVAAARERYLARKRQKTG